MKKKHYLSRKEREEIDAKFQSSRLYRHLRSLALRANGLAKYFSLSPEDLLYHTFFSLDSLLELLAENEDEEEAIDYCRNLWLELQAHFADHVECDEKDLQLAATLVVSATANLLFICNKAKYWRLKDALVAGAQEGNAELREEVETIITGVFYKEEVALELKTWMQNYIVNVQSLSDYIDHIIEEAQTTTTLCGIDDQEEIVEQLKEYFWNDKEETEKFIFSIYGKDDCTVIETLASLANSKPIKILKKKKSRLYKILHTHQLYKHTYQNFSHMLQMRGW